MHPHCVLLQCLLMITKIWGLALLLACAAPAAAEPLEKLSRQLQDGLKGQPVKIVAVLGFGYHDGAASSGSSIVQERLTTFLVQGGKLQVVERSLLRKALEEMKLEGSGLMDPQTTKELERSWAWTPSSSAR